MSGLTGDRILEMIWLAFVLGIVCGLTITKLFRIYQDADPIIPKLRLALACAISVIAESAYDCDGFEDREIAVIENYGSLIGLTIHETRDKWNEPQYVLKPTPATLVRELSKEVV